MFLCKLLSNKSIQLIQFLFNKGKIKHELSPIYIDLSSCLIVVLCCS